MNSRHDVCEPSVTPIVKKTKEVPTQVSVTHYKPTSAHSITAPHPNSFNALNIIALRTLSYVWEKSVKVTTNSNFSLLPALYNKQGNNVFQASSLP